ncbi:zinc ABC transporter substrate-binding protein [uncultured Microbulbifer sp.]|uniref:metal ABC transporter substrate-binding protein n=1 Tax=uncultured Microbulbifer sp. TaxID=348147 RepID=UPI0025EDAF46|nr:zinc ABC transporter substrate-binding protein [uncultured Microbulbifer sp.]
MSLFSFRPVSRIRRFFVIAALLLGGCEQSPQPPAAKLLVVTSIAPLSMLVREVAGDDMEIRQLVNSGDPHQYAPKVADRAAMERAALVVWMGPAMEAVLARQMSQLPAEKALSLLAAGGYEYDGADPQDPHLWLRPRNAALMAAHIASKLAVLDPSAADAYRQRARNFSRAMANLQKVQDRALWAYRDVPIVSTHTAYGQFFGPAGVNVTSLGTSASHQHGARAMLEKVAPAAGGEGPRGCLFGEVPANDRDRQTAEHLNLDYQALDPLGTGLPATADYRALMERLLADARKCLGKIPDTGSE